MQELASLLGRLAVSLLPKLSYSSLLQMLPAEEPLSLDTNRWLMRSRPPPFMPHAVGSSSASYDQVLLRDAGMAAA